MNEFESIVWQIACIVGAIVVLQLAFSLVGFIKSHFSPPDK